MSLRPTSSSPLSSRKSSPEPRRPTTTTTKSQKGYLNLRQDLNFLGEGNESAEILTAEEEKVMYVSMDSGAVWHVANAKDVPASADASADGDIAQVASPGRCRPPDSQWGRQRAGGPTEELT